MTSPISSQTDQISRRSCVIAENALADLQFDLAADMCGMILRDRARAFAVGEQRASPGR